MTLSLDEIKFLGLLLVRQQEYDRALAFLKDTVMNSPEKEIEVLEGLMACFKYRNLRQENKIEPEDTEHPTAPMEFLLYPKSIDGLYHPPLKYDLLDILHGYQAHFEKGAIKEKEAYRIYGIIAEYHVWGTGDMLSANTYCKE